MTEQYVVVDEGQAFLVADRQRAQKRRDAYWRHVASAIASHPLRTACLENPAGTIETTTTAAAATTEPPTPSSNSSAGETERTEQIVLKKANDVPRDSEGRPVMPLVLFKGLTVLSLGTVRTTPGWHSKRYIWPCGFRSVRQYASMSDPETKIDYTNEIVESPSGTPLFRVTCTQNNSLLPTAQNSNNTKQPHKLSTETETLVSETASGVWSQVTKRINDSRESVHDGKKFTQLSGPEMFGFGLPTVVNLLQQDPAVPRLTAYQMQHFASPTAPQPPSQPANKRAREEDRTARTE